LRANLNLPLRNLSLAKMLSGANVQEDEAEAANQAIRM
jgi:hypothetical protein